MRYEVSALLCDLRMYYNMLLIPVSNLESEYIKKYHISLIQLSKYNLLEIDLIF